MATPAPNLPKELYSIFCGEISQVSAQKISAGITTASVNAVEHIHALFQSAGGYVGDGVFLYNLFRSIPIEFTFYNVGQISSAGVVAYLGAARRKTSPNATFMLHRSANSTQFATASKLQHVTKTLILDDERTEAIIREHVKLPEDFWRELEFHDIYLSGKEAVECGIATELGDFAPPMGVKVFNLAG